MQALEDDSMNIYSIFLDDTLQEEKPAHKSPKKTKKRSSKSRNGSLRSQSRGSKNSESAYPTNSLGGFLGSLKLASNSRSRVELPKKKRSGSKTVSQCRRSCKDTSIVRFPESKEESFLYNRTEEYMNPNAALYNGERGRSLSNIGGKLQSPTMNSLIYNLNLRGTSKERSQSRASSKRSIQERLGRGAVTEREMSKKKMLRQGSSGKIVRSKKKKKDIMSTSLLRSSIDLFGARKKLPKTLKTVSSSNLDTPKLGSVLLNAINKTSSKAKKIEREERSAGPRSTNESPSKQTSVSRRGKSGKVSTSRLKATKLQNSSMVCKKSGLKDFIKAAPAIGFEEQPYFKLDSKNHPKKIVENDDDCEKQFLLLLEGDKNIGIFDSKLPKKVEGGYLSKPKSHKNSKRSSGTKKISLERKSPCKGGVPKSLKTSALDFQQRPLNLAKFKASYNSLHPPMSKTIQALMASVSKSKESLSELSEAGKSRPIQEDPRGGLSPRSLVKRLQRQTRGKGSRTDPRSGVLRAKGGGLTHIEQNLTSQWSPNSLKPGDNLRQEGQGSSKSIFEHPSSSTVDARDLREGEKPGELQGISGFG